MRRHYCPRATLHLGNALCGDSAALLVTPKRGRVTCPSCRSILAERDNGRASRRITGLRLGPEAACRHRHYLRRPDVGVEILESLEDSGCAWIVLVDPNYLAPVPALYLGDPLAEDF